MIKHLLGGLMALIGVMVAVCLCKWKMNGGDSDYYIPILIGVVAGFALWVVVVFFTLGSDIKDVFKK